MIRRPMIAALALVAAAAVAGFAASRLGLGGVDERGVSAHKWPGGHEGDYWSEHWHDYARFYARALEAC